MSVVGVGHLTESQRAGQFLVVGIDGTALAADLGRRLQAVCPAGIILFARNLADASQVATLCRELSRWLPIRPFLAIDQEGGRVSRLKGIFPSIPSNLTLASARTAEDLIRDHGRHTGRGLRLLGFNLNFAPVLDLSAAETPNGIGDRAYGTDPSTVSRFAQAFLEAQSAEGVSGCCKHFPGLGGARVDSHQELPVIPKSAEELWEQDLAPYRALREISPLVMVGHAYYPAFQGATPHPATLSRTVVTDILRDRVGYQGIILTDDLEMGAVDQQRGAGEVVLEAVEAGNDLVMYCKSWDRIEEAHATLLRALTTGRISPARANGSLARVLALKERLPASPAEEDFDPEQLAKVCQGFSRLEQRAEG